MTLLVSTTFSFIISEVVEKKLVNFPMSPCCSTVCSADLGEVDSSSDYFR